MKHTSIQITLLLLACVIAGYFFFTTTQPWIFWVASTVWIASIWWGRRLIKKHH